MGKENLGYAGMLPLGQSYAMGQWALHEAVNPDPGDASVPEPLYFDGFWEACQGTPVDRSGWSQTDAHNFHQAALDNIGAVRALFAAYLANGPLPVDVETDAVTTSLWKSEDGITSERHVYYYDNQSSYGGGLGASGLETGLQADAAKYMQVQGFTVNVGTPKDSTEPGAWVLPRAFSSGGQQIFGWRYSADHAGPPYDDTKWTAVFNFGAWYTASTGDIINWYLAAYGAILVIMTAGIGSVAIPGIVAAGVAAGIAISSAEAAAILLLADTLVIGAVKFAITGDSSGLMSALGMAAQDAANLSPAALQMMQKNFPSETAFVKNVAATVSNAWNDAQAAVGAGVSQVQALTDSAQKLATSFPAINSDYWNMAAQVVGPGAGSYFLSLTKLAPSINDLVALEGQLPWYAQGFLQFGATIRAAEIAQYTRLTGGGVRAMPQALVPPSKFNPVMRAAGPALQAILPAVPHTLSPAEVLANAKAAKAQQTMLLVGAAGLGLAYWLGLLKFLL